MSAEIVKSSSTSFVRCGIFVAPLMALFHAYLISALAVKFDLPKIGRGEAVGKGLLIGVVGLVTWLTNQMQECEAAL